MRPLVSDIVKALEAIAPPELAEPWDNGGLLAGNPADEVTGVLVALDVTEAVVREAAALGCSMIAAHHPILFGGTKTLSQTDPQGQLAYELVSRGIAVYAAHTALDRALGGVADALAESLGLQNVIGEDYIRVGDWLGGDCAALLDFVREKLNVPTARLYGDPNLFAARIACVPGSGMDYAMDALRLGARVFITGDVTHHDALDANAAGLAVIDAGHLPTERVAVDVLFAGLQKQPFGIQYTLRIEKSRECPFTG